MAEEQRALQLLILRPGSIGCDEIFELFVAAVGWIGRRPFGNRASDDRITIGITRRAELRAVCLCAERDRGTVRQRGRDIVE